MFKKSSEPTNIESYIFISHAKEYWTAAVDEMSESTSPAPPNKKKTKPTFFRPQGGARTFNTGPRERQFALPIPARPSHASAEQNDDNFLIENSNTLSGRAVDINVDGTCPYHGWMLYFPHEGTRLIHRKFNIN